MYTIDCVTGKKSFTIASSCTVPVVALNINKLIDLNNGNLGFTNQTYQFSDLKKNDEKYKHTITTIISTDLM